MSVVLGILSVLFMLAVFFFGTGAAARIFADRSVELNVFDIMILHPGGMRDFSAYEKRIGESFPIQKSCSYGIYGWESREFFSLRQAGGAGAGKAAAAHICGISVGYVYETERLSLSEADAGI